MIRSKVFVRDLFKEMFDAVQVSVSLDGRVNNSPWALFGIGKGEHNIFCFRVVLPFVKRFQIHWTQLPHLVWSVSSGLKSFTLFSLID